MPRCPPILKRPYSFSRSNGDDDHTPPRKPWTAYLGPFFLIVLLMVPQPSWILLLSSQYVSSTRRLVHLAVTTVLTLLSINSLAICTLRDPGRPKIDDIDSSESNHGLRNRESLTVDHFDEEDEALLLGEEEDDANDFNSSRKWCRTCWAPKPDRTHHCSSCGRCVLRMDHHCPWVSQCVGHRTHAAFLHLLLCVTLLALYIAVNSALLLYDFMFAPVAQPVMDSTPLHCLGLVVMGSIFAMVIGSFFGFHIYLSFTNQTTLEQLSPFLLLKYLPKPKVPRHIPGTDITHDNYVPSVTTRNVPIPPGPPPTNDSPYYFPSPPPTPPLPEAFDTLRHALLASNPLSTIPPSAPDTPTDTDPTHSRVFSASPVATTNPNNALPDMITSNTEWDEHSLSFQQRRMVRRMADRMGLWDLGWRRNLIAVLGSGDLSTRRRGHLRDEEGTSLTGGLTSASRHQHQHSGAGGSASSTSRRGQIKAYTWKWWLAVLFNGGPPRGDGRTFPRNPKARGALEELRRNLEEAERRERGDQHHRLQESIRGEQLQHERFREAVAVGGPRHGRQGAGGDAMELHEV